MFALLASRVNFFGLEVFIKEVGKVDDIRGFIVPLSDRGVEHQAGKVNLVVGSVMTLWAREDGGEGTAESFVYRVVLQSIACEAFIELVFGGVKNRVKVFSSVFLFGGLKIIRQNYNTSQSYIHKIPRKKRSYLLTS